MFRADLFKRKDEIENIRKDAKKRRRIVLFVILSIICVLIAFFSLYQYTDVIFSLSEGTESAPQSGDWTMFRRDMARTGSFNQNDVLPSGTLKWTFTTGEPVHSSPTVVEGTVYIGSRDRKLYALDAETGELRWEFHAGSWVESSPIVVDGVVYFGSNDGNIYALDAETGSELWSFATKYAVRSSPAFADGTIYIGSDDYYLYAVDAETGTGIWRADLGNIVYSSPVVTQGLVVVGAFDGTIHSFNANNGKLRLKFDTKAGLVVSSPAVKDGIVYCSNSQGSLYAIDPKARNWPFEHKLKVYWEALWIYGVAPKPPKPSGLIASSNLGWGIKTTSSPAIVDDHIYIGAGNELMAVDINTTEIIWKFPTEGSVTSSPAIVGSNIYIGSQDGRLYAVDKNTGEKHWDYLTGGEITSSPAVINGMIFIASHDGKVYAFE